MAFWKKVWVGTKIAAGVAVKLNDLGIIKVKELKKLPVGDIIHIVDQNLKDDK